MAKRADCVMIEPSLTVMDGFGAVHHGWPAWKACSGDICSRGLLLFLIAAMVAISLAKLRVEARPLSAKPRGACDV